MFRYYLKLGLHSIRRNPILSSLMVAAIAIGIGFSPMEETDTESSVEISDELTATEGKDYQVNHSDEAGTSDQTP